MAEVDPNAVTEPSGPGSARTIDSSEVGAPIAAGSQGAGTAPATDELIGASIGRYRVAARLGAGGMGVVYRALDPALDRTVALKLLPPLEPVRRAQLEERLRREAQALARLDDPNVLAVYDVGVAEQSLFVAMQFVDGGTLDSHLAATKLPARALLALFVAAGRGLAAAHAAGIVHRDVKPSNMLVDRQGRVYVADFGLARGATESDVRTRADSGLGAEMTRDGAVMGTPLFMSPEQHRGEPATARSDQFSFCVSIWYELFRRHPFVTGPWMQPAGLAAMAADRIVEPPRVAGVSARVLRALRRGLRHDPEQRWPAMTTMLAELAPSSPLPWVLGGLTAAGLAGGAVAAVVIGGVGTPTDPCANAAARIAEVVTPARITALASGFVATHVPYAEDTAQRAVATLDGYRRTWSDVRSQACHANRIARSESDELFDRRVACLDRGAAALEGTLTALITNPSRDSVEHAVAMIANVPPAQDCADARSLADTVAQPAEAATRAALATLAGEVERLAAEDSIGVHIDTAHADALVARARALGWAPQTARVLAVAADAYWLAGHNADAIARMRDAAIEAGRARDDEAAAHDLITAATWLANSGQPIDALTVAGDAEILVLHVGDPGRLRAALLAARGVALGLLSRLDEAKQDFARAVVAGRADPAHDELAIAETLREAAYIERITSGFERAKVLVAEAQEILIARLGPEHPKVAVTHLDLGSIFTQVGDLHAADLELSRAREILVRLGTDTRALAGVDGAAAQILLRQGHVAEAIARYRDVYARLSRLAPDQPETYEALYMVAAALQQQGKWAESLALAQQVVDYRVRAFGENSTLVATALDLIAFCTQALDDYPRAIATRQRSLAIRERALGPDNADVALTLEGLAGIALDHEDCTEVLRLTRRALEIHAKVHSADHLRIDALDMTGSCEARTGHVDEGRATLEQALAIADRPGAGRPNQRASVRIDLGELVWEHGDHARGRKLVQEAYDLDKSVGNTDDLKDLASWLASH